MNLDNEQKQMNELPEWLQKLWQISPMLARQAETDYIDLKKQLSIHVVSHRRELLAISCLKNITNPIKYLKELAEVDGAKLDGAMAIQMTRNGMFYQELANKTLKEIDNCG